LSEVRIQLEGTDAEGSAASAPSSSSASKPCPLGKKPSCLKRSKSSQVFINQTGVVGTVNYMLNQTQQGIDEERRRRTSMQTSVAAHPDLSSASVPHVPSSWSEDSTAESAAAPAAGQDLPHLEPGADASSQSPANDSVAVGSLASQSGTLQEVSMSGDDKNVLVEHTGKGMEADDQQRERKGKTHIQRGGDVSLTV